jgi:hypothetical protein
MISIRLTVLSLLSPINSFVRALTGAGLAIALASVPSAALAQSTWDRYKPGSLTAVLSDADSTLRKSKREVDSAMHATPDTKPSEHFLGTQYPTLATVIYLGRSRPVDPNRLELISAWGRSFLRDSTMAKDFHREYLFQEGKTSLWLAVQDTVASFFPKELHQGQRVNLYVMLLGGYYDAGKITWALIVNEFNTKPVARSF